MKILYIDCPMGGAGDMLMSALSELLPSQKSFITRMNYLNIPNVKIELCKTSKCGIDGSHISVFVGDIQEGEEYTHYHSHSHDTHIHGEHTHSHGEHTHSHGELSHIDVEHAHSNGELSHIDVEHAHSHGELSHTDVEHTHSHGELSHTDVEHTHSHGELSHIDGEHAHSHVELSHIDGEHAHSHGELSHTNGEHSHGSMTEIENIINKLPISQKVKMDAMGIYKHIAQAESKAHGVPVSKVHFHEVGAMDAIADIVGVALCMEEIDADKIIVSPINVGSGTVKCAHGILPVPAPATADILRNMEWYISDINGELCTPTGAAILKYYSDTQGKMPNMKVEKIGYGMGKKDFPQANCVRAFLGNTTDIIEETPNVIYEISCNVDDMTGEQIGFAINTIMENGALDMYAVAGIGKKGRPIYVLTCLCKKEDKEILIPLLFKHTTTIGIRFKEMDRAVLERSFLKVDTNYGEITLKKSIGYGVIRIKPEYEDMINICKREDISLFDIGNEI